MQKNFKAITAAWKCLKIKLMITMNEEIVKKGTIEWTESDEGQAWLNGKEYGYYKGYEDCFNNDEPEYYAPILWGYYRDFNE